MKRKIKRSIGQTTLTISIEQELKDYLQTRAAEEKLYNISAYLRQMIAREQKANYSSNGTVKDGKS